MAHLWDERLWSDVPDALGVVGVAEVADATVVVDEVDDVGVRAAAGRRHDAVQAHALAQPRGVGVLQRGGTWDKTVK